MTTSTPATPTSVPSGQATVLLAEDDPLTARFTIATLKGLGYDVIHETSGPGALARALKRSFDLVLLDLGLPHLDGRAVVKRLRRAGVKGRVCALTAADVDARGLRELGFDDAFPKPLRAEDLGAVAAAPALDPSVFDVEDLRRRAGKDEALVRELVGDFLGVIGPMRDAVTRARDAQDWEALSAAAHRVRGTLLAVGAPGPAARAGDVERFARERDERVRPSVDALCGAIEPSLAAMRAFLAPSR